MHIIRFIFVLDNEKNLTAKHCRSLTLLHERRRMDWVTPDDSSVKTLRNSEWLVPFFSIRSPVNLFSRLRILFPFPPPQSSVLKLSFSCIFTLALFLPSQTRPLHSNGTCSHPITIIHPRSHIWPPSFPLSNCHQIGFYAPKRPRLLNGTYLSPISIVDQWTLNIVLP